MQKMFCQIHTIRQYIMILCLVSLGACEKKGNDPAPPAGNTTFINPIMNGSDPWIIQQGVQYYYTQTSGNRVQVWKSEKISSLASAPSSEIFRPAGGLPYSNNIWAPELHYSDNKWYLYFTGGSGPDETQRTWVMEHTGDDPTTGTWTMKGRLFSPDADFWAIDGTVLTYEGQHYFLWSGRPNPAIQDQQIYIAKMLNPWTLDTKSTLLTTPTFAWERVGGPVNEAPQILKHPSGKVYMVYSASGCWTDDYSLGMLSLKTGGNPLVAADWTKSNQPVFSKNPGGNAFGPGHNAFFKSPEGSEDWIMYHANNNTNEGCGEKRNVRIQPFTWNASGVPQFGAPVATGTAIKKPAGE